jgi:hypothetical protein
MSGKAAEIRAIRVTIDENVIAVTYRRGGSWSEELRTFPGAVRAVDDPTEAGDRT